MQIRYCLQSLLLACCSVVTLCAQSSDSLKNVQLQEVSVVSTARPKSALATQPDVFISRDEMHQHIGHSLMDALAHTEGVQAMDIGVGFSKPMIRGLGFQRIAVTENGIKQEGQQWGADHGLEIDAFHVEGVRVVKGPASVLYGSDAMGGAIELLPPTIPQRDTLSGEAILSYQSVSTGLNGSLMLQHKYKRLFTRICYTERHWADYRVPADSFTYLSMRLPIANQRLKNTAGMERSVNALMAFRSKSYQGRINLSNSYQKSGFFSGAHGIPSALNLTDDGDRWNIGLPYSLVNHFKVSAHNTWSSPLVQNQVTVGYQVNHREEWSRFHTHNPSQQPPLTDPDKELMFHLQTGTAQWQLRLTPTTSWELYGGLATRAEEPFFFKKSFDLSDLRNAHIHHHDIVIPENAAEGNYHLVVYCTDAAGNQSLVARDIIFSHDAEEHHHEHDEE